ncbi:MAG TPA: hypothetical protein VK993_00405 [Chthoniobacterales bacterium]|nr:hypothetical protein [Chthoniobacterales bacterium]
MSIHVFKYPLLSLGIFLVALCFAATDARAGWAVVPPASSNGRSDSAYAVTCTSDSDCWAVGDRLESQNGFPYGQTLIERWNGTAWTRIPSPNTSATESNALGGVACTSASDCWAVGYYQYVDNSFPFRKPYLQTLIQRWNGTTWSIFPSPNSSATETNRLNDVTCTSASDCWAVGYYTFRDDSPVFPQLRSKTLIQRWNGTAWNIVASPETGGSQAVTCVAKNDCWAVGGSVILHWNGASWSSVPEPRNTPENPIFLNDVTCTSSSDCWAVGGRYLAEEQFETLIEHWDGKSWTVVPSPNPDPDSSGLTSVACSSASDCSAVGGYFDGRTNRTLIERWNGKSWTIVPSADPSTRINRVRAVTCLSSSSVCWAAGDQLDNASGASRVFFQRFTPSPARLLNISTRAQVQTGENVMIGGFIITGSEQKNVLLRAIGPSLSGVPGALQNPTLELFQGDVFLASNDDWKQAQRTEIEATGIAPSNDAESAILRRLGPGNYSAVVRGANSQTGVALVEAYDLDQGAGNAQLANISTRAFVHTDDKVLIGGIIIGPADAANSRVLVRAIGPSLSGSGVPAPLQDPARAVRWQWRFHRAERQLEGDTAGGDRRYWRATRRRSRGGTDTETAGW